MREMCPKCGRFTVVQDPRDDVKRCTWLDCRWVVDGKPVKENGVKQYNLSKELAKSVSRPK